MKISGGTPPRRAGPSYSIYRLLKARGDPSTGRPDARTHRMSSVLFLNGIGLTVTRLKVDFHRYFSYI
jgi:hypothetical protein